jgi:ABC-type dipeptide/oligopeptide/nickel transport system permease component/ABC-type dipeptide/oligopeptide/nickel transport system permease subunit
MAPVVQRLLWVVLAGVVGFFAITVGVYFAVHSVGNLEDPFRLFIRNISPSQIKSIENFANLDYLSWLSSVLGGSITSLYVENLGANQWSWTVATLEPALPAVILGGVAGWIVGTLSSRRGRYFLRIVSLALVSLPAFWTGGLLLYQFSFVFHALPSVGTLSPSPPYWGGSQFTDQLGHLILPIATFTITSFAIFSFWIGRSSRGYSALPLRSALRASARETLGFSGLALALLLAAAMAVEAVFLWPGLGYATARAFQVFDIMTVSVTWTILGLVALLALLFGGVVYALTIPVDAPEPEPEGLPLGRLPPRAKVAARLAGVTLLLAIWGGFFAPYPERSYQCLYQGCANLPPFQSWAHPLGTELNGVDVLSDTLHGLANDLATALAISAIAIAVGTALKLISSRPRLPGVIKWAVYLAVAFNVPLWSTWFGRIGGIATANSYAFPETVFALGLLGGLIVSLSGRWKSTPGGLRELLVQSTPATIAVAGLSILLLEYVGFLGFTGPGASSLGLMLSDGFASLAGSPWVFFFPGLVGAFAVFSLLFLADSLGSWLGSSPAPKA